MRAIPVIAGVIALLVGIVWILQGADILMGSVMSGSTFWLAAGVVAAIVGGGLLALGIRPRAAPKAA